MTSVLLSPTIQCSHLDRVIENQKKWFSSVKVVKTKNTNSTSLVEFYRRVFLEKDLRQERSIVHHKLRTPISPIDKICETTVASRNIRKRIISKEKNRLSSGHGCQTVHALSEGTQVALKQRPEWRKLRKNKRTRENLFALLNRAESASTREKLTLIELSQFISPSFLQYQHLLNYNHRASSFVLLVFSNSDLEDWTRFADPVIADTNACINLKKHITYIELTKPGESCRFTHTSNPIQGKMSCTRAPVARKPCETLLSKCEIPIIDLEHIGT